MWPQNSNSLPYSYHQTQANRIAQYEAGLAIGEHRPFIYPWDSLPALYLLLAAVALAHLPVRLSNIVRWPALALILAHCIHVEKSCRTIGFAGGYGIGLSATWGSVVTFALLVFNDIKTDFRRLEAREKSVEKGDDHKVNGSAVTSSSEHGNSAELRRQAAAVQGRPTSRKCSCSLYDEDKEASQPPYQLSWRSYPPTIRHVIDWNLDLMTSFRGVNWTFRDPTIAPLDTSPSGPRQGRPTSSKLPSIATIRRNAILSFTGLYLVLDTIKLVQSFDPYFLGLTPLTSPTPYPSLNTTIVLLKTYRLLLTVASVITTLSLIFQLCPIFFTTVPLLVPYPRTLAITHTPLLSPEMYLPYWGSLFPSIASKGLAGFWGRFWHQMFRFGISQPSAWFIRWYNLDSRSNGARTLQVLTAFCLSGTIHASASYTSFAPVPGTKHPITGPWAFFMLQGIGILLQSHITRLIKSRSFPLWLRQSGNAIFVLLWLYLTGPLLADDLARCGVWLFEPLPISIMRGVRREGWWRWGGRWVGWYDGGTWWRSGLAIY